MIHAFTFPEPAYDPHIVTAGDPGEFENLQVISMDLPQRIGEALPQHHCEVNPRLANCTDNVLGRLSDEAEPLFTVGAVLLLVYAFGFIGHVFVTTDDHRIRMNVKIALAVGTVGILATFLFS